MRPYSLALLGCLPCLLTLTPAHAAGKKRQEAVEDKDRAVKEECKKLYERGMVLYDLRKFDQAIEFFEKAYQLLPQPAFLYNIAQSYRLAGRRDEAIAFYKNYLRKMPEAPNREEVEGHLKELEKSRGQAGLTATPPPSKPPSTLPPPQPYPEPKSKHNFLTHLKIGNAVHTLVGVGSRSYLGFLVYGMGFYVEDQPARLAFPKLVAQAGGREQSQLLAQDLAQNFVLLGDFGKAAIVYYVRDVNAGKIRDSYKDMLKDNLTDKVAPPLRKDTETFLSLFDRDMKAGEEMIISATAKGEITVTIGSYRKVGPVNPRLALDLWGCWLGKKPVNADLKADLVRRISALGE